MAAIINLRSVKEEFIFDKEFPTNDIETMKRQHGVDTIYEEVDRNQKKIKKEKGKTTLVKVTHKSTISPFEDQINKKFEEMNNRITDQDKKIIEQDKKIIEQDKKIIDQDKKITDQDMKIIDQDKRIKFLELFSNPSAWLGDLIKQKLEKGNLNNAEYSALKILQALRNTTCHRDTTPEEAQALLTNIDEVMKFINPVFGFPGEVTKDCRLFYIDTGKIDAMEEKDFKLPEVVKLLSPLHRQTRAMDRSVTLEYMRQQVEEILNEVNSMT